MTTLANKPLFEALKEIAGPSNVEKVARFFKGDDPSNEILGVPIGSVFPVAKRFTDLPLLDVEDLLDDPHYEIRMAGVAIMDFKARNKKLVDDERKALFDLYIRRHDRINNWDLVDRAAPHVIGEYLVEGDRTILDKLARSKNPNERRTALVCTHAFIKRGETADTFRIASLLADDSDQFVQKAVASWTREAGKKDKDALIEFLSANKDRLPRPTITAASTILSDSIRDRLRA